MSTLRPASILTLLTLAAAPLLAQGPEASQAITTAPASGAQAQAQGQKPVQTRAQAHEEEQAQAQAQEPAQGQEPGPYSDQIIWSPTDPTNALFVPQEVLDTTPLDELPMDTFDVDRMRQTIEFAKRDSRGSRPSVSWRGKHERWPLSEKARRSVDQLIAADSLAFIGTVEDTVPGWSNWSFKPETAIYLRVDEILRNEDDFLELGKVVAMTDSQATINLYGVEASGTHPEDFWVPRTGDQILFTGFRYEKGSVRGPVRHPFFLNTRYIFLVHGDKALPEPMDILRDTRPRSLEAIRGVLEHQENQ